MSSGQRPAPAGRPAARPAPRAAAPRIPPARPGTSGTAARPGSRRGCGWTGPPAAGTWRSCAASRSGRPARPARCRCPAPGTRSRPGPAGRRPQPRLHPLPPVLRQAAVVRGDLALPQPLAQLVGDPLGHPPGVHEDQRGPVLQHVPGDQVQDLVHLLGRRHRAELVAGQFQGEVELAAVAGVHDRAARRAVRLPTGRGPRRPAAGRRSRSGAGWPTGRSAAPAARPGAPAAPGSGPGGSLSCCPRPRGSHRR